MRKPFPDRLERARVSVGPYQSERGDPFGYFEFKIKSGRQRVKVRAIAGDGYGWDHVSVSLPGRNRCPTWDEMCTVKDLFFPPDESAIQFHPPTSEYVNTHPYVLHLWRIQDGEFPVPPIECV